MRATALFGPGLCLAMLLGAVPARAALTAAELSLDEAVLNQFNVVTFGDYTAGADTDGRIAVGGDFIGSGNAKACDHACTNTTDSALGATYGSLNVWGNVSGGVQSGGGDFYILGNNAAGSTLNMNDNGGVNIAGSNNGTIESANSVNIGASSAGTTQNFRNGVPVSTSQPTTTTFPFPATMPFEQPLKDLATGLAADATAIQATDPFTKGSSNQTLTVKPAASPYGDYGIITTTISELESQENLTIDGNGLDAVVVVVTGDTGTFSGSILNASTSADVIWDFVDATSLTFDTNWYGQILAPDAAVTIDATSYGAIVADSLVQNAEIDNADVFPSDALNDLPTTSPSNGGTPVPEPSTIAVIVVGVLGIALARRRRAAV